MKFTIPHQSFSEVGQKAPLRWALCYKDGDSFEGQHGWWKCKDFLNDTVVYLRTGQEFEIYGYENKAKINDEGGYLALKNVPAFFEDNLIMLNEQLLSVGLEPIECFNGEGEVEKVVLVPSFYWSNTFFISFITSLIRSCVYAKTTAFIDCINKEETLTGYFNKAWDKLKPEHFDRMNELMFLNYQYNAKDLGKCDTYLIHNAGLQSWCNSWDKAFSEETV